VIGTSHSRKFSLAPLLRGEGWGERLSGESSCIGVLGSRIPCFGVEANEQFARERNSDDHFFFPAATNLARNSLRLWS